MEALFYASSGLGQAQVHLHAAAHKERTWAVQRAMREDADQLAVVQKALRDLIRDLGVAGALESGAVPPQR